MSFRSFAKMQQYMVVEDLMKYRQNFGASGIDASTRMTTREIMLFAACQLISLLEHRPCSHNAFCGHVLLYQESQHDLSVSTNQLMI